MKTIILNLLILFPLVTFCQEFKKCNDLIAFLINKAGDNFFTIKINGKTDTIRRDNIFFVNNISIQSHISKTDNYKQNGTDDINILTVYIFLKIEYFTKLFKKRVDAVLSPVNINDEKKSVMWFFDLPKINTQDQNELIASKQVLISIVNDDYIYTISSFLFQNQDFTFIKQNLIELIKSLDFINKDALDKICD